jgi:exosome complex RNA-binding protein Rrp4
VGSQLLVLTTDPSPAASVDCTCVYPGDADWASGECVLGELKGGLLIPLVRGVDPRELLDGRVWERAVKRLGKFEVAVGFNGVAWVRGRERELNYILRRWGGGRIGEELVGAAGRLFGE